MAKKNIIERLDNYISKSLDDIVSDRFGNYSKYIIQERALPDGRDGLKPVQRRILYSMLIDGNVYEKAHRKSAKTVGSVMGEFHPHGDSSIYEAMVRMSQDWKMNLTLIDMHGNNGSIDDDPAAAMRYTEARLSKNAKYLLEDIDKNTVVMTNNYDDTCLEPTVLPLRYPLLLVNGSTGIASGYATNIAPHNLNEVIDATIYRLKNPNCSIDELMQFVKGPDFPTGGIVQGLESIKEIFETGKGKVIVRAKTEIVENKTHQSILITEIPYEVIKSNLVKKLTEIFLSKEIDGILDVKDESDRNGLKIVVEVKKDINADNILNYLFKHSDLQINYNYNSIAIINHTPTLVNLKSALDCFINHRQEVVLNRSKYLKSKKSDRLHIIEGLIKAISILDDIIEIIRKSNDKQDSINKLKDAFLFTNMQAEAIVNLRLYRLSSTDINLLKDEFSNLSKEIIELNAIIESKDVLNNCLINELKEINTFIECKRKTKIENEVREIVIDKMQMINNEVCYISLSKDGYLKRYTPKAFNSNPMAIPYCKDEDSIIGISQCTTLDTLLVFTSKGDYAYLPVFKIDESKFKDIGKHISTYVKMQGQEKIVGAVLVSNFETYNFIYTLSKNGLIKKTSIPKWNIERSSKALCAMKLKDDDELVSIALGYKDDNLLVCSTDGRYNCFANEMIQDTATKSLGVKSISVKYGNACSVISFNPNDNLDLLLSNANSQLKRIHLNTIQYTARGSKGNRLFKIVKSNPSILNYAKLINSRSSFYVKQNLDLHIINASDIALMDTEQSFSTVFKSNHPINIISQDFDDIATTKLVSLPDNYYNKQEQTQEEQTTLF